VFITNIYVVIVTDITNINFQLQKSVITNICKLCASKASIAILFSTKSFFWRFNILFSTQTRQICVELAKLKFQDSSRPLMRKSFFAMKRGEIERVKPVFLSLSQPSAQAEHSHTLGLAV